MPFCRTTVCRPLPACTEYHTYLYSCWYLSHIIIRSCYYLADRVLWAKAIAYVDLVDLTNVKWGIVVAKHKRMLLQLYGCRDARLANCMRYLFPSCPTLMSLHDPAYDISTVVTVTQECRIHDEQDGQFRVSVTRYTAQRCCLRRQN